MKSVLWTLCALRSRVSRDAPRKTSTHSRSSNCNNRHKARRAQNPIAREVPTPKLDRRRRLAPQAAERAGLHCVDALVSVNKATNG